MKRKGLLIIIELVKGDVMDYLKILLVGIIEGITEWLPVSSTGHMILFDEWVNLPMTPEFKEVFMVVIQLGAILAVVGTFWKTIWPFARGNEKIGEPKILVSKKRIDLWLKIIVAMIPAAVVGILLDDFIDKYLYNYLVVAASLLVFGVFFILVENKHLAVKTRTLEDITYKEALIVGLFQVLAAVFPGTSRSGATIIGGLIIGMDRVVITEFTFILAIPVMFGASLLKLVKYGLVFTGQEVFMLLLGMIVALVVSVLTIRFLLDYIKKNDFKVFGYYRIILGVFVFLYFLITK